MLQPDDELPPPIVVPRTASFLLRAAALLIGTATMAAIAVGLYRLATEPLPSPATSSSSGTPMVAPTFPREMISMAIAVTTSLAPSPTPVDPTPTYAMLPTPQPPDICLTSTPKGSVCTQPRPPLPPPTPIPICPVSAGQPCLSQGGPVTWPPTSTPSQYDQPS